jgi:L-cysteate sulfo-lyase
VHPAASMTTTLPRGPASEYTDARARLARTPSIALLDGPTPVQDMPRLRAALGGGPRLMVKRDDAIPFGFGGNKVRKLELAGAAAVGAGADTLVTVGGVQSNHARATAATAVRLGLRCLIIANGQRPQRLTGNALLNDLLGADIEYIASRNEREPAIRAAMDRLRRGGRVPFEVPLGASTPLGALGFARAIGELVAQDMVPDVIVHASSSGGTQAGIVAGCTLWGLSTRVIGVSADDPAASIQATIRSIIAGTGALVGLDGEAFADARPIVVDDGFIGDGYGVPSPASTEAQRLAARTEALFVDHAYTAKALGALIAAVRAGRFRDNESVLFWHTGGQAGLLA